MAPLDPNRLGALPSSFSKYISEVHKRVKPYRMGVMESGNSLIHCMLLATNNEEYLNSNNKEDIATTFRFIMTQAFENIPHITSQETFGYSTEDILEILRNNNYLDPFLFIRLVEYCFECSIYMISSDENNPEYKIEIPRCRLYHIKELDKEGNTVIIYINKGTRTNTLEYPHCELVVLRDDESGRIYKLQRGNVTNTIYNMFIQRQMIISGNRILKFYNIAKEMNATPISQEIDSYGKSSSLTMVEGIVDISKITTNDVKSNKYLIFTVIFNPSYIYFCSSRSREVRVDLKVALGIDYGKLSIVALDKIDDVIYGLWLGFIDPLDVVACILCNPIKVSSIRVELGDDIANIIDTYRIYRHYERMTSKDSIIDRQKTLNKIITMLVELITYLFDVWIVCNKITSKEMYKFYNEHINYILDNTLDSIDYYNILQLPRLLPQYTTYDNVISEMSKYSTNLFRLIDGKWIIMLDSKKTYQGIISKLRLYASTRSTESTYRIMYIRSYYYNIGDFKSYRGNRIFNDRISLDQWISDKVNDITESDIYIHPKLDRALSFRNLPFAISYNDSIYMIQNVSNGNIDNACYVSYIWKTKTINIGYDVVIPKTFDFNKITRLIYNATQDGTIIRSDSNYNDYDSVVISYVNKYAAMLKV